MALLFTLTNHFESTVQIGDHTIPIRIKRLSRAEMEAFEKKWGSLVVAPRGTATLTPEESAARDTDQRRFLEDSIREAVTIDEGLIEDLGKPVTDGVGILGVFHARPDILGEFLVRIYVENKLSSLTRKNSNSPQGSGTGSGASSQARGGDRPEPIAESARPLAPVVSEAATAESSASELR